MISYTAPWGKWPRLLLVCLCVTLREANVDGYEELV